jgi:hypothetical protein
MVGGQDATKQFNAFHRASVLDQHAELCIGTLETVAPFDGTVTKAKLDATPTTTKNETKSADFAPFQ